MTEPTRCPRCHHWSAQSDLAENLYTCSRCEYHWRISAAQRIQVICDVDSYRSLTPRLSTGDPLSWSDDRGEYIDIVRRTRTEQQMESFQFGCAQVGGNNVIVGAFDFTFLGGTLGSVTGECVAQMLETAVKMNLPVILACASGGARMQEGMFSLMQMAKISTCLHRFRQQGGRLITVLCDPTTGGVAASIAFMGDFVLAEPSALVGFSGPRVIVEAIGQEVPDSFQASENRLGQGLIDAVVRRKDLAARIRTIVSIVQ